jgi:hypothetical protein
MFRSLSLILSNKFNLVNLNCISFSIVCKLNTISIHNFEIARDELDHRTKEIHESLLDQQTQSMKYNLIFENIPEVILNTDMKEDTQQILKDFLQGELEIENVQFHNVHRDFVLEPLGVCKVFHLRTICLSQCRHVYFDHGVPSWLGPILAVFR